MPFLNTSCFTSVNIGTMSRFISGKKLDIHIQKEMKNEINFFTYVNSLKNSNKVDIMYQVKAPSE